MVGEEGCVGKEEGVGWGGSTAIAHRGTERLTESFFVNS